MLKKEILNFGFTEEEYDVIINNYKFVNNYHKLVNQYRGHLCTFFLCNYNPCYDEDP